MARAPYIVRKDGRYFFHKRFVSRRTSHPSLGTHMRLALRTADYRIAVDRMLKVMRIVQQYELNDSISSRAALLIADLKRLSMKLDTYDAEALVERRTLEMLIGRLIVEARLLGHPLNLDPPDFWSHWMAFCNTNMSLEEKVASPLPVPAVSTPRPVFHQPVAVPTAHMRPAAHPFPAAGAEVASPAVGTVGQIGPHSLISDALKAFLEQRSISDGDGRAAEDKGIVIQFLIDFLGDRSLSTLTSDDFIRVENALPDIPHPKSVPAAAAASLFLRWQHVQQHGWEGGAKRISKSRLTNGWHGSLHAFLKWARAKACSTIPEYTFELVNKENPEENDRDAWRDDEILKLFSLPLFTGCKSAAWHWQTGDLFYQNHLYWTYLLIFFTGMRPSEIGKIPASKVIENDGIWYFDLRKRGESGEPLAVALKSRHAFRLIPIPRLLIDLGLIERRDKVLADRYVELFPEWKKYVNKKSGRIMWGHEFSKSWQYVKRLFKFERRELTIYGGRHTRATWYDEADIPQRVRIRVMGHAPTSVADRYGATYITPAEAKLLLSRTNSVEEAVAEILITAKLRADYGELAAVASWAPSKSPTAGRRTKSTRM